MFANFCEMVLVAYIRLTWRTIGRKHRLEPGQKKGTSISSEIRA